MTACGAAALALAMALAPGAPAVAGPAPGRPALEGACHASRLGQPCPTGDSATQGEPVTALNIGAGNPVHLVTGNKYQREVDLPAAGPHAGLEIVRHYNAMDTRAGMLGRGWVLSYDTRLYAHAAPRRVQIAQADGSRVDFDCGQHEPACRPLAHGRGRLHRRDGQWRWRWPDGRALHFDASGRLTDIEDAGGRRLRIVRDTRPGPTAGAIAEVIDQDGKALRFFYEIAPAGARLSRIDTPFGSYRYTYDAPPVQDGRRPALRLTGVTHPAGWRRVYIHEAAMQGGDPYRLTGIAWRISDDAEPLRTHSWAYDDAGRAILSAHGPPASLRDRVEIGYLAAPGADGAPGLTRVRSAAGVTDFHTALRGGRAVLLGVEGAGCPGCAAPGMRADYDAHGRLQRLNGVHLERDADGALTRLRDRESGWPGLSLSFDAQGRLAAWSSDATGREARRHGRTGAGTFEERRYANGDVGRHAYDSAGRPVEIIASSSAGALRTVVAWRGASPVRVDHPHERETRRHDARGRLVARVVHRPALAAGDAAYTYRERYAWDGDDRLVRHDLPEGGRLTYRYEASGRLVRIAWEQGGDVRVLLQAAPDGGYLHGNGLRTRGLLRQDGLHALAVDDPSAPGRAPVLLQRLRYDAFGRIAGETMRVADWHGAHAYGHDAEGRLSVAAATLRGVPLALKERADERGDCGARSGSKGGRPASSDADVDSDANADGAADGACAAAVRTWRYAWRAAGDALATQDDMITQSWRARRDASGLPAEHRDLSLRYGPDRRLASVSRGPVELARYEHNAYGERIRRRAAGRTEDYLYVSNRLAAIARMLPRGGAGVTQRFVYAGWVPVAMIVYPRPRPLGSAGGPLRAPSFYAVHADAIGMPHAVTDATRQVRWRALWSPTGAAVAIEGELSMPLRQPGHVHDPATGLHDNYLRTYDPRAGHYLEPDPAGPMPHTQAYGYADQQPRRHIDPYGLLLFAFDGTNRDRDARTNVALMSGWYADGTAYYHRGPGFATPRMVDAATGGSSPSILETQWNALLREVAAAGHAGTVKIDLLGYSRGAALALHFGNMIAGSYRAGRFWTHHPAMGPVTACADLRFMGLFDAVAQFGVLGSRNAHYNLAVPAAWRWVAHAVALHERRRLFPLSATPDDTPNAVTAPFIGAHGDIGGGYLPRPADADSARPGGDLSDVALAWMLKQAAWAGAAFLPPPEAFRRVDNPILHDERNSRARRAGEDRAVLEGAGATLMANQAEHPRYGDAARTEVEAFIRRVENWAGSDDAAVAAVDMDGYREWLRRTLDLETAS
jgi:RHS repeat-associated protein